MNRSLWLRRSLYGLAFLFALIVVGVLLGKTVSDKTFFSGYDPTLPLVSGTHETQTTQDFIRESIVLQLSNHGSTPVWFFRPTGTAGPVPCFIFLYGIGQKLAFLDEIAAEYTKQGVALVGFEQLGQGYREIPDLKRRPFRALNILRKRAGLVVPESRRLLDYLETRPELDPEGFYLLGVSFGALSGAAAMARDERLQGGVMMWGGGDLIHLMMHSPRVDLPWVARVGLASLMWFLSPADPLGYIADISPRPLLFQNPVNDEIFPAHCMNILFEKAGDPKTRIWYECGHEKGLSIEIVKQAIEDQVEWVKGVHGNDE